ncbi:thrombospondin type 3 repeat-containing protein [Pedobacter sp. SYP-B3415]|uniref:thrombospondin type 3 repeat-containing protein n=1 Tax=Pedobacter sp. SYP-B3415 TaxID=2496641 RepID=UPI00101B5EAA
MKRKSYLLTLLVIALLTGCKQDSLVQPADRQTQLRAKLSNEVPCPYLDDRDCDSVPDNLDNCPDTPNADQSDHDNDGIGDVCDTNNGGPTTPPQLTGWVSAETYLNRYCAVTASMTYNCGLAKGISEVLNETKELFKNAVVYEPVLTFYKVSSTGSTDEKTTKEYCDTSNRGCYITYRSVANEIAMRQSKLYYLEGKLEYIDSLREHFPHLADYYEGYRIGCIQAYWFTEDSLTTFHL